MSKANKKFKVLFIQLNRFGDLLQTLQCALSYKTENPDREIHLIGYTQFVSPLLFLLKDVFDEIHQIDTKKLFKNSSSQSHIVKSLKSEIAQINHYNFQQVFNLSFSKSSEYLTTLISSNKKKGLRRNKSGQIIIEDQWSQYVFATTMSSNLNPFNLVDLFKSIVKTKMAPLIESEEAEKGEIICIHPFASLERKQYGFSYWEQICSNFIIKYPEIKIYVLGSDLDEMNFQHINKNNSSQIIPYFGKSFEKVLEKLNQSKLLIANDSMVGHLSAFTSTPSLTLALGSVRPEETTPYKLNAYVLEPNIDCFSCSPRTPCDFYQCHYKLNPKYVFMISELLYLNGNLPDEEVINNEEILNLSSGASLFKYDLVNDSQLHLSKLHFNYDSSEQIFRNFYFLIWNLYLNNQDTNLSFPYLNKKSSTELLSYKRKIESAYEIYSFGSKFSSDIIDRLTKPFDSFDEIQPLIDKLNEIDTLLNILKEGSPLLSPIINFFYVQKMNITSNTLIDVARDTKLILNEAQSVLSALLELSQKSIENNIKSSPSVSRSSIGDN
ncbi:hypothetical protein N9N67_00645 [Bacteriovoracaceae bacterium]|nr:hypothetical protein [Bacteriovoracaceae bacterium]